MSHLLPIECSIYWFNVDVEGELELCLLVTVTHCTSKLNEESGQASI